MAEMKVGRLANEVERFCPFAAVNKWPYKYLRGEEAEKVSKKFFAFGEFRSRGWTVYYIRTLLDSSPKPLLLIPKTEVEALFYEIYTTLGIHADFPPSWDEPGFDIGFIEEGSPRPRYLGLLTSSVSLTDLEEMMPAPGTAQEEQEELNDSSFPAFRRKMEAAILAGKQKNKAAREKKRRDRVNIKRVWCAQLKRVQCYLGIRPRGTVKRQAFHADPNHTWEQEQSAQRAYEEAAGIRLPRFIPTDLAPYFFHQNVVFICIDIEAYEMNHKIITEIGISTLDTLDLASIPSGEGGEQWMQKIRARHFRVAEYATLRNSVHVSGCPDRFLERFGRSEWIGIKDAPQVIASCFRHPFSAPGQYTPLPSRGDMVGRYGIGKQLLSQYLGPINDTQKRNIVLVGHDIKSDIEYLRTVGYDVTNLPNLLEAVDTIDLFKAMKHDPNTPSLGAVLRDLERTGWHLHNAGNDAGYTLEALIGISLAALTTTPKTIPDPEHLDAAASEAQLRLIEEKEEWDIANEEGGDGGSATPLPSISETRDRRTFEQGTRRGQKAEEQAHKKHVHDRKKRAPSAYRNHREDFKPSVARKGETKFHSANEKKMTETAEAGEKKNYVPPHLRGAGNAIGSESGKGKDEEDMVGLDGERDGGVKLGEQMLKRLAILNNDDDYFIM